MDYKAAAGRLIDDHTDDIILVSKRIHSEPELGHQEVKASRLLVEELKKYGFEVKLGGRRDDHRVHRPEGVGDT